MKKNLFLTIILSFFILLAAPAGFTLAQRATAGADCSIQSEIPMGKTIDNAEQLADDIYTEFDNIYTNALAQIGDDGAYNFFTTSSNTNNLPDQCTAANCESDVIPNLNTICCGTPNPITGICPNFGTACGSYSCEDPCSTSLSFNFGKTGDSCPIKDIDDALGSMENNFNEISGSYDMLDSLINGAPLPPTPMSGVTATRVENCDVKKSWSGGKPLTLWNYFKCDSSLYWAKYKLTNINKTNLSKIKLGITLSCFKNLFDITFSGGWSPNYEDCDANKYGLYKDPKFKFSNPTTGASVIFSRVINKKDDTEIFDINSTYIDSSGNMDLTISYNEKYPKIFVPKKYLRFPKTLSLSTTASFFPPTSGPKKILDVLNQSRDGLYSCKNFISDRPGVMTGRTASKSLYSCDYAKRLLNIFQDVRSAPLNQSENCGDLISGVSTTPCKIVDPLDGSIDEVDSDCQCYCVDPDIYKESALDYFCCYY